MAQLTVESGPIAGRRFTFEGEVVLGRGELADVRLDDTTVSRRHAIVRPDGDDWVVEDLGSANGTFVGEQRVEAPTRLVPGDPFRVGQLRLSFALVATEPTQPPPLTPLPEDSSQGRLFQDLLSRVRLFVDLGELGASRPGTPEELTRKCLAALLQAFARIDRCAVFVHVPVGDTLSLLASTTRDGRAMQPTAIAPLAREALRHQQGLLLLDEAERNRLTDSLRMNPLYGAAAAFPARHHGEAFGVLYLDSLKDGAALRASDREHLAAAASLVATLVAPLREPRRDFQVQRNDLTLARRIQQRFLPQSPPTLTGYRIVDSYAAARVIGGDHYDFLTLADGRHAVVVADVSGEALSGALYMARLGAVLKQAAVRTRRAAELLDDVNRVLYAELEAGMFVTMCAFVLEPRTGALEVASAGHAGPLVRRRDGKVETLDAPAGPPLGTMSDPSYQSAKHALGNGDCALLYTLGLSEAQDANGAPFGLERVRAVLAESDGAETMITKLREAL
ncbi:MAG TPA: SpoIIE family protein phosphatase, partial [Xanthomonadales bacterium]|nr:SpoIIE family protein phosphatase [Xanthomonadales bacterium]